MWRVLANRRVLLAAGLVAALLLVALWPQAVAVDVGAIARGAMVVTIDEEGETRVHHRFVVSAPVAGRLERVELEPGDPVARNQTVVARIRPEAPQLLDARTRLEAGAAVEAARGAAGRARAEEQRARAALELASSELKREQELFKAGLTTRQALETRQSALVAAEESVSAAGYAAAAAQSELERAQARLAPTRLDAAGRVLQVLAPVHGVVLRRFRESESVVPAGEPILEIGDPSHVEIVADLLSTDAVKVKPGMRVSVEQWGGDQPMGARVERVEPAGFTKVSALGVEEQRVNVIMDFDDDQAAWKAMGDAYRVEVRIALASLENVLEVPTSALFRVGEPWAVYVVEDGRARRAIVDLGQRTRTDAEVLGGLQEGQQVVLHPPETLTDGARVTVRP
ncbi:MAG: efflux RND transporter periplasmic adaptor subunit [Acidobacteria bacterium]|nr:efflux RND transporter periplasmic adaptor subunit [Acidobacteriota bacterium]